MKSDFTIGFKFRNKDYTATVSSYSTSAATFFQVTLNDMNLIVELDARFNFVQDALSKDKIQSLGTIPNELKNTIIDAIYHSL